MPWKLLILLACLTPSCILTRGQTGPLARYEYQQPQMGLPFRIVLYAPDRSSADAASTAAFARIKQLNDIMSDYDADSELSRLSRSSGQGRAVAVSDDLWIVLKRA